MYDRTKARAFLIKYFTSEELLELCSAYFEELYDELNDDWSKPKTIRYILDYCKNNGLHDELLTALKEKRPVPFDKVYLPEFADKLFVKLRESLSRARKVEAQKTWQEIQDNELEHFLNSKQKHLLDFLLIIIDSNEHIELSNTEIDEYVSNGWFSELVGSIMCREDFFLKHREKYITPFSYLLNCPISQVELHDRFIQMARRVTGFNLEEKSPDIKLPSDKNIDSPLFDTAWREWNFPKDPLLHIRAEDEQATLCKDGGFWLKQDVFNKIFYATENQVVYGQSGSGRTALAKTIYYEEYRGIRRFSIYLSVDNVSKLDLDNLYKELAQQLWSYVCSKPTLLIHLHEDQRTLLGSVLAQILTTEELCKEIEDMIANRWWESSPIAMFREHRKIIGNAQLDRLKKAFRDFVDKSNFHHEEDQWLHAFTFCVESFGFPTTRLLLDFSPLPHPSVQDFVSIFLRKSVNLFRHKLTTTFFLPTSLFEKIEIKKISASELKWNEDELKELVRHRFDKISDYSFPLIFFDSDETYETFFSSIQPLTPRRVVQLWHMTLRELSHELTQEGYSNRVGEVITMDVLQRAQKTLEAQDNDL